MLEAITKNIALVFEESKSIPSLAMSLIEDHGLQMAAETKTNVKSIAVGVGLLVTGSVLVLMTSMALSAMAYFLLKNIAPDLTPLAIVSVIFAFWAIMSGGLIYLGIKKVSSSSLLPTRSFKSIGESIEWITRH